ncbi:uncharacterized protein EI97DRAFT_456357 [Westerdykella ornata]|uniref:S-adenosyl-L-methionine-dependent methyltransferase n=1 Tax=Westerdykella ornata TaxID=318751 RepID=A0A6A6JRQ0_WESOR|nr:uncharacterized protein EI97DRAFT_456357 [Westerdykella ornata]KAF2278925.1 hypothetical protein EI97DRAFT_456357 [Westerdykella ornata]
MSTPTQTSQPSPNTSPLKTEVENPNNPLSTLWSTSSIAQEYLRTERITRPYADVLVQKAGLADLIEGNAREETGEEKGEVRLWDFACGTGAVVACLYDKLRQGREEVVRGKIKVLAADVSPEMVAYTRERGEREGWKEVLGLETRLVDVTNIPPNLPYNPPTHLTLSFALMALPTLTLSSLHTQLAPSGTLALTTWSSISWYTYLLSAAQLVLPPDLFSATPSELGFINIAFPDRKLHLPETTERELRGAGFADVSVEVVEIEHEWVDARDFVRAMELPIRAVSGKWGEGEERSIWSGKVKGALVEVVEGLFGKGQKVRFGMGAIVGVGRKGN